MNLSDLPLLSITLWLPIIGMVALLFVPRERIDIQRVLALAFAIATFVVSAFLYVYFDFNNPGPQFVEQVNWVPSLGITYSISVDGVSLWLVLLATFLGPVAFLSTWEVVRTHFRAFQILMLLLLAGMVGVFIAQDLFLFYVFYELTLIPMALLIGMWGSVPGRVRAAVKFFLYTFTGSVFMLLSIIALYLLNGEQTGVYTFDFPTILQNIRSGALTIEQTTARLLFAGFFIAFAIKVPVWPFHTWLPGAHTQAPTAGSVDLASVMLKIGGYGFIRFCLQLFPEASRWAAPVIGILAVIGIVYGAVLSFTQSDIKRLVAYSSVSHLGYVVLGIFALNQISMSGAILQMVNHGLSTGALFIIAGMIYERRHTREMAHFGGLWRIMPIYGAFTLLIMLSSVGLPGLNGFVGEFTIMQGTWLSPVLGPLFVIPAVIGIILAATYLLRMFRQTFLGESRDPENEQLADLEPREIVMLGTLLVPIIAIGLFPNVFFDPMQPAVAEVLKPFGAALAGAP